MKIVFLDNQNKNKSKKYGPFKSVMLIHEWLVGDNDEIAIFVKKVGLIGRTLVVNCCLVGGRLKAYLVISSPVYRR